MNHMLSEIREQPEIVRQIMDREYHHAETLAAEIRRREIAFTYIAARGTSYNAAKYAKYMLEIQHGLPVALAAPSVFTVYDSMPRLGANAFVLGISQSGSAPDVLQVVRQARESGALTACITNEPDSALAQAAEYPLFIGAGEEIGVAATKTYTGSLALLALLSTALDENHPERLEHLRRAANAMERTLNLDDTLHQLVARYTEMRDCIVLGRGYNHSTADETALKVTETCSLSAQAFSGADFQHGSIAQVTSGFPCLLFAPEGKAFKPMLRLAEMLRDRQSALICFAHDPAFLTISETAVRIPAPVAEWVSPLVYAVAGQLFAYWLSMARGNDPDAPRGISSVTQTM
jgi:glucosamine--fructose-6-phosphate aminotransferase (isomerizing)